MPAARRRVLTSAMAVFSLYVSAAAVMNQYR
jgi:hypothetical protein